MNLNERNARFRRKDYHLPVRGQQIAVSILRRLGGGWVTVIDRNGGKYRSREERLVKREAAQ